MPLPSPNPGENQSQFVSRCMGNPTSLRDFPDQKQRAAVCYAQWNKKEVAEVENEGEKMLAMEDGEYAPLYGAQSFEELDQIEMQRESLHEMQRATSQAEGMISNVMRDPNMSLETKPNAIQKIMSSLVSRIRDFSNKALGITKEENDGMQQAEAEAEAIKQVTKTEGGIQFRASDYAVVPDAEMPSTWKLRLVEGRSGNFTVAQVGRAITAMQPGGFRGQRVELTAEEKTQAISRISAAIGKTDGDDNQKQNLRTRLDRVKAVNEAKENIALKSNFWITKDKNGDMYWYGFPSNKWRDRDNPPQIISEAAHKDFIDYLDKTDDYPVLLGWHTPGTRIGKSTWAEYDHGFLIMGGVIDKDKHAEAERLAALTEKEAIGMSHGFVYRYADKENEIIGKYRTWEVSHLPITHAANVWTNIQVLNKEVKMAFSEEKRRHLNEVMGEGFAEGLEKKAADLEKDLLSAGTEFKEMNLVEPEVIEKEADPVEVAQKAATLIVESESFKNIIDQLTSISGELTTIKETTIPALEQKITEANVKTQKSHDDIIAEAMKSKGVVFQASQQGEPPSEQEKDQNPGPESPVDLAFMGAMTNMPAFDGHQQVIAQ